MDLNTIQLCATVEKRLPFLFLFFIPVNCAYRKEETSIIIEMEYLLIYFYNYKNKPGKKKRISFLEIIKKGLAILHCASSAVCGWTTKTYRHRYRGTLLKFV